MREDKMSRFDYVKYDEYAANQQSTAKAAVTIVESFIEQNLSSPRAKRLAFTKLEECYMWIGKAIRDDQIERSFGSVEHQEERKNS